MGNSKARISERTTNPNHKPRKKRWNYDWMVPSKNLDSQFKEFRSSFNKEEAKVEEDNTRMEVRIDASEYKPDELKVSVQSGRLLVEGRHEEKKEDGSGYV